MGWDHHFSYLVLGGVDRSIDMVVNTELVTVAWKCETCGQSGTVEDYGTGNAVQKKTKEHDDKCDGYVYYRSEDVK